MLTPEVLAPAMFAALALVLLAGFPVAFSIAAVGAVFGAIGIAAGHFHPQFLLAGTLRIEGFFHNDNLLAIPLFVFMGMLLERTRIAADMLITLDELFGKVRGGMGLHLAVAIGIGAMFILIQKFAISFATSGNVPVWLGMWIPNLVFSIVALWLVSRAQK